LKVVSKDLVTSIFWRAHAEPVCLNPPAVSRRIRWCRRPDEVMMSAVPLRSIILDAPLKFGKLINASSSAARAPAGAVAAAIESATAATRLPRATREEREENTVLRSISDELPHLDVA
jgi:hypothetical protein